MIRHRIVSELLIPLTSVRSPRELLLVGRDILMGKDFLVCRDIIELTAFLSNCCSVS